MLVQMMIIDNIFVLECAVNLFPIFTCQYQSITTIFTPIMIIVHYRTSSNSDQSFYFPIWNNVASFWIVNAFKGSYFLFSYCWWVQLF